MTFPSSRLPLDQRSFGRKPRFLVKAKAHDTGGRSGRMPAEGQDPAWPDKAMFAAILLMLAGIAGLVFRMVHPLLVIDEDDMPGVGDPTATFTTVLCAVTLLLGLWSFLRQAAWAAFAGAASAVASLAMYGLVSLLGLAAFVAAILSRREGEETRDDDVHLPASLWPDKAMAASLFLVVVGGIAITQAVLILKQRYDPILIPNNTLAGGLGLFLGALCILAARETYHVRRPWLAWTAFIGSLATVGFFLVGPLYAIVGMVLLLLAHHEGEFDEFAPEVLALKARRRGSKAAKKAA
jgi:hypothetical protein